MSIFDKFQQLAATRQELEKSCDAFFNIVMQDIISGTEAIVNGRPTILAGSNNYLADVLTHYATAQCSLTLIF